MHSFLKKKFQCLAPDCYPVLDNMASWLRVVGPQLLKCTAFQDYRCNHSFMHRFGKGRAGDMHFLASSSPSVRGLQLAEILTSPAGCEDSLILALYQQHCST